MMMMGPDHRRPPQRIAGQVLHHRHSSSVLMSNEHRHLGVLSADDVATVAGNQLVHLYLLSIWASAGTRVSERQPYVDGSQDENQADVSGPASTMLSVTTIEGGT
mmetsp:Transcript_13500/g.33099  ORF Transcript_13500/g.33099 Transcript_13500/m.33099 type:complete len:105 (-) Transcript_13500:97-411(-)